MNACQHLLQVMLGTFVNNAYVVSRLSDEMLNVLSES